ncbi:tetratricopeptide repeat protein [Chloroflexi bacterium TSY]|nr:tetratricopeptide repeat protein [Chloroflexi bacterium TSY]
MTASTVQYQRAQSKRPWRRLFFALLLTATVVGASLFHNSRSKQVVFVNAVEPSSLMAIEQLRMRLQRNPNDEVAYAQLGLGLLQRVRITGDATLYTQAKEAFDKALQLNPHQIDALIGQGILALALHDFHQAIEWAEQALNPFRAQIVGILVDAYVELGRYDEAVQTAQRMVDLRPDLHSYSRISYIRELHGDVDGAIEAMRAAVDAGVPGTEEWLWAQVQLGHLNFNRGDLDTAEQIYTFALRHQTKYAYAVAGLAQVQTARGNHQAAIASYRELVERLPLPEFVIALGELYVTTGQLELAREQYDLVRVIQQLNADAGQDVGLELARFNADHGEPVIALAQAKAVYAARPTIYAADTLAWALHQNQINEEAWTYSQEALRLGTQDASMHFHAGAIAQALGDVKSAKEYLQKARSINPALDLPLPISAH